MPCRREYPTTTTWEASVVSLAYPEKTKCPTLMPCLMLAFPICTLCSDCDGWVMSTVWRMVASKKTSAWETRRLSTSTLYPGSALQLTNNMQYPGPTPSIGEDKSLTASGDNRARWKERSISSRSETARRCDLCDKDCHPHWSHQPQAMLLQLSKHLDTLGWITGAISDRRRHLWAAVFTFNPYLLISINELLISIIHLLTSINELLISINELLISVNTASSTVFIDIYNSFIDINKGIIDINNSFIDIHKYGWRCHIYWYQ